MILLSPRTITMFKKVLTIGTKPPTPPRTKRTK